MPSSHNANVRRSPGTRRPISASPPTSQSSEGRQYSTRYGTPTALLCMADATALRRLHRESSTTRGLSLSPSRSTSSAFMAFHRHGSSSPSSSASAAFAAPNFGHLLQESPWTRRWSPSIITKVPDFEERQSRGDRRAQSTATSRSEPRQLIFGDGAAPHRLEEECRRTATSSQRVEEAR